MKTCVKKYDPASEYYFAEGCFITELSNSPDDAELSIARARVAPGETTRWHALDAITERYVILEGTGRVELGDSETQMLSAGDVVLIPAQVRQRISNIGEQELVFLAICSPPFQESQYVSLEAPPD